MTKDEIKKALECCTDLSISHCKDCPYNNKGYFNCVSGKMCKDALNLIIEQEKDYSKLQEMFANYQLASDKEIRAQVKQAKIEVLNKVKERAVGLAAIETYHICNLIDKIIKEVENEQKD